MAFPEYPEHSSLSGHSDHSNLPDHSDHSERRPGPARCAAAGPIPVPAPAPGPGTWLVIGTRRGRCELADERGTRRACSLSARGRALAAQGLVVGDRVRLRAAGREPAIGEVLPRANRFTRRDPGARARDQVIAANLDQVLVIVAIAQPQPRWGLLDRMLVGAEAAGIPVAIVAAKSDLAGDPEAFAPYARAGYAVLPVSTTAGRGLAELRARLAGRITLLAGASGVGKTSLVAALTERTDLRAAAVSARTGKGRHTTTELDAHPCEGGWVIDSPGVRTFGLSVMDATTIAAGYPEIRAARAGCRFGASCTHVQEPDCAVKAAVGAGCIDPRRYRSYLRLIGRDEDRDDPRDADRGGCDAAGFTCRRCGAVVPGGVPGSAHRNHCPICLWSRHVDHRPGDRAAGCEGNMEPVAVMVRSNGEWALIHRCAACGALRSNRIAGDDNGALLLSLAARPLARPPFPLERMVGVAPPPC